MDYAFEQGVNFFDTAELYTIPPRPETQGESERIVGTWLKKHDRQDMVIATKMTGPHMPHIREGKGIRPEDIASAVERSLTNLNTDYIDLYQIDWPQRQVALWGKMNYHESMYDSSRAEEEYMVSILQEFQKLQDAGKVRSFGLSNETPWGTMKWLHVAQKHNLPRMQSVQNAYSLLRREYEVGMAEVSMQESCGLLAYSPLAGGVLTGKYRGEQMPEGSRYATWGMARFGYYLNDRSRKLIEDLVVIADELGITLTQLSLAFVNDRGFVASNIIGTSSLKQAQECISSAQIKLSEATYSRIDELFVANPNPSTF